MLLWFWFNSKGEELVMNVKEKGNRHDKELMASLCLGKGEASWEQEFINSGFVGKIS